MRVQNLRTCSAGRDHRFSPDEWQIEAEFPLSTRQIKHEKSITLAPPVSMAQNERRSRMNRRSLSALSAAALLCLAWTSSPSQVAESSQLAVGSTIPVTLEKGIDARKNKAGDNVIARTTENVKSEGQVLIPRGSRILGRVSEAKARSAEEPESVLGIIFDRAVLKGGRELPLALTIQAIAPARPETSDPSDMPRMTPATAGGVGGGSDLGPMSNPNAGVPGRVESPNSVYVSNGQLTLSGGLTPSCHGVLGIEDLALAPESADSSSSRASRIISQRHNVHLYARTQMMLRVLEK